MKLEELAKDLDFENGIDYYNYIIDSYINGNRQQVKDLFNDMEPDDQINFFNSYLDHNCDHWKPEAIKEVRNICIDEAIKNKTGFNITI